MTQRTGNKSMMNIGCCLTVCIIYLTKGIGRELSPIWMGWWSYDRARIQGYRYLAVFGFDIWSFIFCIFAFFWEVFSMTNQEIKDRAPDGATDYLIYDDSLYYFQKRGTHMHQWIRTRFNPIPFSCSAFYKFKPL